MLSLAPSLSPFLALSLFPLSLSVLLADGNKSRREAVRKKTAEYLQYAEYLQRRLDNKAAVKVQVTYTEKERERSVFPLEL